MRLKKIIPMIFIFLLIFSTTVFANEKKVEETIFMGKVQAVQKSEKDNTVRIKTNGYIRGCKVYQEEIIAIISEETFVIADTCKIDEKDKKQEKVNLKEFNIKKGDIVFMKLNKVMTKSIPPQVGVKAIQITQVN
ncbi:hypothetical protein [Clostridium taeniosporum]|uniref:DUF5666 domain-containing protein n=1 Tax=Clostridium taeniosporum TaxID=394958 RepID=A0A1D7XJU6_9CLOT|nr:hypothetical protein [Clostridium taeniosporum]AOR23359.1 hypothetical protein BGI42_06260 [Clostridium taeniosporum]